MAKPIDGIRGLGALSLCAVLLICLGCASTQQQVNSDPSTLRVGVSAHAPPLIFKQGEQIVGLEADFAREFTRFLRKPLQFVELGWDDLIPALLDGRIDIIMSGMTITELRQVRIAFSKPYFKSGQMGLVRNEDVFRFKAGYYSAINTEKIGVIRGTTGEYYVERNVYKPEKVGFSSSREAMAALVKGKIGIFIHDAPIALYLASEKESRGVSPLYHLLTEEYLAWGIRKQDGDLLAAVDAFIGAIKEGGQLSALIQKWIPMAQ